MEKPWMPVVAGILDIISGSVGVLFGLFMALKLNIFRAMLAAQEGFSSHPGALSSFSPSWCPSLGLWLGIALIVIGILAIVGGIFALRTKVWGLALAGSIGAVLTGRVMGVLALIFIILGRKDFQNR